MRRRFNLDGKTWLKYSISIWDDLVKTKEEKSLDHPAVFPVSLVERLIDCYMVDVENAVVLDPFLGSGTTLVAARNRGLGGIGFEVKKEFVELARKRLENGGLFTESRYNVHVVNSGKRLSLEKEAFFIVNDDARKISDYVDEESVGFAVTSPPYWIVHKRKRTADGKREKPYSDLREDLGNLERYRDFLAELKKVYRGVYSSLVKGGYFVVNVMDIRCNSRFFPYHCDTISICESVGFVLEDIIIWDRRKDYNNLRPLGYPHKFIVNKVHEYLLVFRKDE